MDILAIASSLKGTIFLFSTIIHGLLDQNTDGWMDSRKMEFNLNRHVFLWIYQAGRSLDGNSHIFFLKNKLL